MNITITSTTDIIDVSFNDLSSVVGLEKGTWKKDKIISITLSNDDEYVNVDILGESSFSFAYSPHESNMIIDSIDGIAPTSNSDLYNKLVDLI